MNIAMHVALYPEKSGKECSISCQPDHLGLDGRKIGNTLRTDFLKRSDREQSLKMRK
jgi:hypothetical protein